jgi:pimeloyl-ACP methyl ester carboxylesterase
MSSTTSRKHRGKTSETLCRRKALVLGSMGIASALLERSVSAGPAVAEASIEQHVDASVAGRISPLAKRVTVNGLEIEYEVIGKGSPVVITPGGRFSKETPGVRELAEALARGGKQVLIWDRPNCGGSEVSFDAETESKLNASTLAGLLRTLGMAPALLVGGSAGSRVSLLAAEFHPDVVSKLFIFWISGGPIGLATLTMTYCAASAFAANSGGMEAVAKLPEWAESIRRNPGNRARILSQNPERFIETMQRWGGSFFPLAGSPVPGMTAESFRSIRVPTMVLRSGKSDLHHTRKTSEEVHALIAGAIIAEPPWPDNEWNMRGAARAKGEGLFGNWPKLAPQILDFAGRA